MLRDMKCDGERERDVYILVPWYMWIDQSADLYQCKKYFWFDQSSSNKLLNTWSHGTWNWYHYMYKRLIYEVHWSERGKWLTDSKISDLQR